MKKLQCKTCKGTGENYWEKWYGKELLSSGWTCQRCNGSGFVFDYYLSKGK